MKYDYERFRKGLGVRVKRLREERGLSPRRMVYEFGFHLNQIAKLEDGEPVSMDTILKCCDAFDMTVEELLHDVSAAVR